MGSRVPQTPLNPMLWIRLSCGLACVMLTGVPRYFGTYDTIYESMARAQRPPTFGGFRLPPPSTGQNRGISTLDHAAQTRMVPRSRI